jgi:hypothetical protein
MSYACWRACERIGILPPGVKPAWDDNDTETRSLIIAYDQIRGDEDAKREANRLAAGIG